MWTACQVYNVSDLKGCLCGSGRYCRSKPSKWNAAFHLEREFGHAPESTANAFVDVEGDSGYKSSALFLSCHNQFQT